MRSSETFRLERSFLIYDTKCQFNRRNKKIKKHLTSRFKSIQHNNAMH